MKDSAVDVRRARRRYKKGRHMAALGDEKTRTDGGFLFVLLLSSL